MKLRIVYDPTFGFPWRAYPESFNRGDRPYARASSYRGLKFRLWRLERNQRKATRLNAKYGGVIDWQEEAKP